MAFALLRVIVVMGLVVWAGVLATPPSRIPLALRGLNAILKKDLGLRQSSAEHVSTGRKTAAFLLAFLAFVIAVWPA